MKELARVLYGSQNYGLDGPDSDKDYMVLLCPEYKDFYDAKKVCAEDVPIEYDREHYSPMNIIQFHNLLMKGNPNCIEMLFSTEWSVSDNLLRNHLDGMKDLYRRGYVAVVWDSFYAAIRGLALNGIDRNGVNGKTVSRAYYLFWLVRQIESDNFSINGSTWRNGMPYSIKARDIRFGNLEQERLDEIQYGIRAGFARYKQDGHKAAIEYKNRCSHDLMLKQSKDGLDYTMRRIVGKTLYRDLKNEYGFESVL